MKKARYHKDTKGLGGWALRVVDEATGVPICSRKTESTKDFLLQSCRSLRKDGYDVVESEDLLSFPTHLYGWERIGADIYYPDGSSSIELFYVHPRFNYTMNVVRQTSGLWSVYLEKEFHFLNCRLEGTKDEALDYVTNYFQLQRLRQYV